MNRIILAYAPENAALAQSIDRSLGRIGIPFEHVQQDVATQLSAISEPILLLVTDNFLTNPACMTGLLPIIQSLVAEKRLVAVLADGVDATGNAVPTQIDRMANALHYMKYWQDEWLARSDRHQQAEGAEKAMLTAELDATREIANQVGDFIGVLRESGYTTWERFSANDFELFFQQFDLKDWHGQYKRLVAQTHDNQVVAEPSHLPEMPVLGGFLAPEPMAESPEMPSPEIAEETVAEPLLDTEAEMSVENMSEPSAPAYPDNSVGQSARDAWFWMEKGHVDRGLELFQIALEQFPEDAWLRSEYERAQAKYAPESVAEEPARPSVAPLAPAATQANESKSYELMGDMAAERGDFLFAKYCWDRVVEIDPNYPDIYRKLGLMTAEHLRDYRETAAIYLRKALEINPNDDELRDALAQLDDTPPAPVPVPEPPTLEPAIEAIVPKLAPAAPPADLVLITGATSGIGRATAMIFARNGYRLILTGRRVERLVELKNLLEAEFGTEVLLLPFDVRDAGAVEAALSNLPESFQHIDILVNNAGLAKGLAPIHEGNLDHWETMIDTNVKGLLYVSRLITPGMVRRRKGHVINVCSSAGKETYPNGNVYCATKFAVDALTKSMRFDLHAHNIRVSQVSPGHVEETEFALNRFDGDAGKALIYNDFQPLKSSDVADAIFFMATRPPHVNIQDLQLFGTQQASSMVIDRSGRNEF